MLKRLVAEGILTREEAQTGSVVDDDGSNHEPGAKKVSKATRAFNEFDNMIRCKYDVSADMYDNMSHKNRNRAL